MESETKTTYAGNGFSVTGMLGVAFVVLKLIGKIDWSWWWVLAPFWIPWAVLGAVLVLFGVLYGLARLIDHSITNSQRKKARP